MSSSGLYKSMKRSDAIITSTGLVRGWWSQIDDVTTLQEPTLSDPPVLGEKFKIDTDHVWAVGKEAISLLVNSDTLEAPGESNGDVGSLSGIWRPKIYIPGDGSVIQEIVDNIKNEWGILWVQNECDTDAKYIQYGCACDPIKVEKFENPTGTKLGGGTWGYILTFRSFCKYFYNGAISERA
jgi:hypothetical protein